MSFQPRLERPTCFTRPFKSSFALLAKCIIYMNQWKISELRTSAMFLLMIQSQTKSVPVSMRVTCYCSCSRCSRSSRSLFISHIHAAQGRQANKNILIYLNIEQLTKWKQKNAVDLGGIRSLRADSSLISMRTICADSPDCGTGSSE